MKTCKVEGCANPYHAKGYCRKHYSQFIRKNVPTQKKNHAPKMQNEPISVAELPVKSMPSETLYQSICSMLQDYDTATENSFASELIADPGKFLELSPYAPAFYVTSARILVACKAELDKKQTPKNIIPVIKRIINNNPKAKVLFRGIFQRGDKYFVCDGFRLIRMADDITSLPHVENNFKIENFFDKNYNDDSETFELPSISDIKSYISAEKAIHGKKMLPISIGHGMYVNPQYLLDMIIALPECTAYVPDTTVSPIYFKSKNGNDGILMPVHPPKEAC